MTWILIRTTGFVAYAFLSGAAIFGLLVATKVLGRSASAKSLTYTHESLSVAAILSTIAHMVFLYMDSFIEFSPAEITVPGASDWNPRAVNMGILAFYGLVVITLSFYVRKWIGQGAWRLLHFGSFGVFVAAAYHGITAGSDSSTVFAVIVYTATISLVVGLTLARVVLVRGAGVNRTKRPVRRPDASSDRGGTKTSRGNGPQSPAHDESRSATRLRALAALPSYDDAVDPYQRPDQRPAQRPGPADPYGAAPTPPLRAVDPGQADQARG